MRLSTSLAFRRINLFHKRYLNFNFRKDALEMHYIWNEGVMTHTHTHTHTLTQTHPLTHTGSMVFNNQGGGRYSESGSWVRMMYGAFSGPT